MEQAHFHCRLSAPSSPLPHVWECTVGSGHALLALRSDWQQQMRRCHDELGFQYVRFHGLLSDDVGTLVRNQDQRLIFVLHPLTGEPLLRKRLASFCHPVVSLHHEVRQAEAGITAGK